MTYPNRWKRDGDTAKKYAERRSAPRLPPSAIPSLKGARLVAGPEVELINISRGGALIVCEARLSPGSNLCVRLVTAESIYLLKGRVVRSRAAKMAGTALRYQIAVAFDEEFSLLAGSEIKATSSDAQPAEVPSSGASSAVATEVQTPPSPPPSENPAVTMVTAKYLEPDAELQRIFEVNDW